MKNGGLSGKKVFDSSFQEEYSNPRVEAFICVFNRCLDWPRLCSMDCLNNGQLFSIEDADGIRRRLGLLRTFDALGCCRPWRFSVASQPSSSIKDFAKENRKNLLKQLDEAIEEAEDYDAVCYEMEPGRRYTLDIARHEEWNVMHFLCTLSSKEEGESLARGESSEQAETDEDYFRVPPEWATKGPPIVPGLQREVEDDEGEIVFEDGARGSHIISVTYMTEKEEYIDTKARCATAERFCGWPKAAA